MNQKIESLQAGIKTNLFIFELRLPAVLSCAVRERFSGRWNFMPVWRLRACELELK